MLAGMTGMPPCAGSAAYYSTYPEEVEGEIRFMFQPAEEVCPGGAVEMIRMERLTEPTLSMVSTYGRRFQ